MHFPFHAKPPALHITILRKKERHPRCLHSLKLYARADSRLFCKTHPSGLSHFGTSLRYIYGYSLQLCYEVFQRQLTVKKSRLDMLIHLISLRQNIFQITHRTVTPHSSRFLHPELVHSQLLLDLRQIHTILLHLLDRKDQFQLSGDHPQQTEYRSPRFQKIIKKF